MKHVTHSIWKKRKIEQSCVCITSLKGDNYVMQTPIGNAISLLWFVGNHSLCRKSVFVVDHILQMILLIMHGELEAKCSYKWAVYFISVFINVTHQKQIVIIFYGMRESYLIVMVVYTGQYYKKVSQGQIFTNMTFPSYSIFKILFVFWEKWLETS